MLQSGYWLHRAPTRLGSGYISDFSLIDKRVKHVVSDRTYNCPHNILYLAYYRAFFIYIVDILHSNATFLYLIANNLKALNVACPRISLVAYKVEGVEVSAIK